MVIPLKKRTPDSSRNAETFRLLFFSGIFGTVLKEAEGFVI
jgi:hypothetical protein